MVFFVINDHVEIERWIKIELYFKFVYFSAAVRLLIFKSSLSLKFEFINNGKAAKMWHYTCKIIMLIFDLLKSACCTVYSYHVCCMLFNIKKSCLSTYRNFLLCWCANMIISHIILNIFHVNIINLYAKYFNLLSTYL